jgi:hypothetical protein
VVFTNYSSGSSPYSPGSVRDVPGLTLTGFTSQWNGMATTPPTLPPLTTNYRHVLDGMFFSESPSTATVGLDGLTIGYTYKVQIWMNNSRDTGSSSVTATSAGGNSVTLSRNTTGLSGGVGQYGIGSFTAAATTENISLTGSSSAMLTALQVRRYMPPAINGGLTATGRVGDAFSYIIPANDPLGGPTSFSAAGLPPGLAVNTATGEISGTPTFTTGSPYSVTVSASNADGTGTATLVLTINFAPVTIFQFK